MAEVSSSLGKKASRGAGIMGVGQLIRIAIQFSSVIILARLLDASSFGLIAMVTAVIGVAEVVRDFGLAPAAIQAKSLSVAQRSNLFWINLCIGIFLAVIVTLLSNPIGELYDDDRVPGIMYCLSSVFIINAVSTQYRAGLSRELRFGALALSEILGQASGLLVAVVLAMLGAGYWAIVGQQISQALVLALAVIVAGKWWPRPYNRAAPVRSLLTYGSNLLGTQLLVYVSSNIDTFLIGLRYGPNILGYYNRAFQMIVLPLNQINSPATRVALPVLSRIQEDKKTFDRYLIKGQVCLSWVVIPVFMFAAINSDDVVHLLLGDGWGVVAPLFTLLAIGGVFQTLSYATYWVFLARGLTGSNLRFALTTRTGMIGLIALGSIWGVSHVAIAYASSLALIWVTGLIWIRNAAKAPVLRMFGEGLLVVGTASLAAVTSKLVSVFLPVDAGLPAVVDVSVAGTCFLLVFIGISFCVPVARANLFELFRIAKVMIAKKSRALND